MQEEQNKKKQLKKQKKIALLAVGIFLLLITLQIFFVTHKSTNKIFVKPTNNSSLDDGEIIFEQPKLSIFGELRFINQFPDRIHFHYPFFIVVNPGDVNRTTTVLNVKTQTKVVQFTTIGLDYSDEDYLFSNNKYTFFNKVNLGLQCDQGFIKSKTEIYCITAKNDDPLDNKLIIINPQTLSKHDVYSSSNLLESVSVINGVLYVSELNMTSHQAYITIGNKTVEVPTQADIIYPMRNKVYYATFKVTERKQEAEYYEIKTKNNAVITKLVEKGRITF